MMALGNEAEMSFPEGSLVGKGVEKRTAFQDTVLKVSQEQQGALNLSHPVQLRWEEARAQNLTSEPVSLGGSYGLQQGHLLIEAEFLHMGSCTHGLLGRISSPIYSKRGMECEPAGPLKGTILGPVLHDKPAVCYSLSPLCDLWYRVHFRGERQGSEKQCKPQSRRPGTGLLQT